MNYEEAMKYIDEAAKFSMKLGLSRTEKILEILENPHRKIKCIHIAGTNGKGSTTAMISSILKEAGYKVGIYTSPYIEEFEERIQINGINIPKDKLAEVITKVSEAATRILDLGYDNPTQFEIITCAGFLYFYEQNVDYAVIEVGLGGRLDSTNVIKPILSVITSISYDHMNVLGDTLGEIAYEKGGIIKDEVPTVLYPQEVEAYKAIEKICVEKNSHLINVQSDCVMLLGIEDIQENDSFRRVQNIKVKTKYNEYDIKLALLGKHQLLNCSTVLYAVEELKTLGLEISGDAILNGLNKVKWPGRFEILNMKPLVVIDGAHNIDGIRKLKESIDMYLQYKETILILGILADKQVEEMVKVIVPGMKKVICVTPHSERAELASELRNEVIKYNKNCIAVEDYEEAYNLALSYSDEENLILISGSLYMIGDMRKIIKNKACN
jgi:dihydrofolate synthase/folylpolyglutamate synthase